MPKVSLLTSTSFPLDSGSFLDQRRYVRCATQQGRLVKFILKRSAESLLIQSEAILLDKSFGGLGLILATTEEVYLHQLCYVEIEDLGWVKCQIAWVTPLSDELYKRVGVKYITQEEE